MPELRRAVSELFSGPVFYAFEVGRGSAADRGQLHVHVIAHRDDGPQRLRRGGARCKPVYDPQGLLEYLHKPAERYSLAAENDYKAAQIMSPGKRRAPKTRGYLYSASRLAWAEQAAELNAPIAQNFSAAPCPAPAEPSQRCAQTSAVRQKAQLLLSSGGALAQTAARADRSAERNRLKLRSRLQTASRQRYVACLSPP